MKETKEDRSVLGDLLRSPVFPIASGVLKAIVGVQDFIKSPYALYLLVSGASDIFEGIGKLLIYEAVEKVEGTPQEFGPYGMLEKHILYDLPKYAINKLRGTK